LFEVVGFLHTPANTQESMTMRSVYGFTSSNFDSSKEDTTQKVANTIAPISACIYAKEHGISIPLITSNGEKKDFDCPFDDPTIFFNTEVPNPSPAFINPPPNDVCVTIQGTKLFYESKIAKFTETDVKRFELILRQDCYSFNCIQSILLANPEKKYSSLEELVQDTTLHETPYLILLLCRSGKGKIEFEPIIFTDVSLLHMVWKTNTGRSNRPKEGIKLINTALLEHKTTGKMTYKETKSTTVAHQRVSLNPFKALPSVASHPFSFPIKSTDIILKEVTPDWDLWHEVEKIRLKEEVDRLRALLALHGLSSE
jgi:hypothetical protein